MKGARMRQATALHDDDPRALGPYGLTGRLGAGGQGVVYVGQGPDRRPVAVKLLHPEWIADPSMRARFAKEVAAARRVSGFCTARVLAADTAGPRPYIVSEYIDGPSLQQAVQRRGPWHGAVLEGLAVGTATALAVIHQAGVVHRDFKPGNVLIAPDGPKVIDFGVARALDATATVTSHVIGTAAYMAPEQARGEPVGPAADMFAWGCTIAFAATGRAPFGDDTVPAVLYRVATADPDLRGVPGGLRDIVANCLRKDPATRPTAREVARRVVAAVPSSPLAAEANRAVATLSDPPAVPSSTAAPSTVPSFAAAPSRTAPWERVRRGRKPLIALASAIAVGTVVAVGAVIAIDRAGAPTPTPVKPTTQAKASIPAAFAGTWRGMANGADLRWTVRITLTPGQPAGRFELPSLRCAGTFDVQAATGSRLQVATRITADPDSRCVQREQLSVDVLEPGRLRLNWPAEREAQPVNLILETDGPPEVPKAAEGTWTGVIYPDKREVKITVEANDAQDDSAIIGTVEYPGDGCRGTLAIVSGSQASDNGEGRTLGAIEDFGRAPAQCREHDGMFNITVEDGGVAPFTYDGIDKGTLRRR